MSKENAARFGATDLLMLLATLFWAVNFSVVKIALREFSPHAFNGPRLTLASLLLLGFLWKKEGGLKVERKDLVVLAGLGIVGNTFYQTLFINGIDRTTASTTSLVMTMTPIFIALMSAIFIRERIHWAGWVGILISFGGLYLVLFGGAPEIAFSNQALKGNLMILAGNFFWAIYTVFSKPYLEKYSPLKLTALTLAIGTLFYLPIAARDVLRLPWGSLSARSWAALLFSAVFAIALSYFIWYSSVRRIGNTKTGIFGNITPVFTVFFAHLFLGERVTIPEVAGAAVILLGFYLTRFGYRWFETRKPDLI
jgi:drug/metabolite transporter (DMT)-like permease